MPVNRNALIRYKTIDNCLRNPYRRWTLEDLVDACSDALYEYEGIDKGISKRAVQMDIQMMRSEKPGIQHHTNPAERTGPENDVGSRGSSAAVQGFLLLHGDE